MQKNKLLTLTCCIYTIAENTESKMKHLENLKINLSKFQSPKQLIEYGIKNWKNCVHLKQYQVITAYYS